MPRLRVIDDVIDEVVDDTEVDLAVLDLGEHRRAERQAADIVSRAIYRICYPKALCLPVAAEFLADEIRFRIDLFQFCRIILFDFLIESRYDIGRGAVFLSRCHNLSPVRQEHRSRAADHRITLSSFVFMPLSYSLLIFCLLTIFSAFFQICFCDERVRKAAMSPFAIHLKTWLAVSDSFVSSRSPSMSSKRRPVAFEMRFSFLCAA